MLHRLCNVSKGTAVIIHEREKKSWTHLGRRMEISWLSNKKINKFIYSIIEMRTNFELLIALQALKETALPFKISWIVLLQKNCVPTAAREIIARDARKRETLVVANDVGFNTRVLAPFLNEDIGVFYLCLRRYYLWML
jgi:hypothetical protein